MNNLKTISLIFLSFMISCNQTKEKNKVITIGFGGDTMLGRLVNETISKTNYKYPWGNMLPWLQKNDLNIINLETTITKSRKKNPKVFNFRSDPENVEVLKVGKIGLVNLANNHILDFSNEGLFETIKTLDESNILHVGAGKNIETAKNPAAIEKNGIKIGVLGYTDNEPGWLADENKPGINYVEINENGFEKIKKDIELLKNKVDIVVVSIHWGPNKIVKPTQKFIDFAHKVIDCGADIIHGHSAHIFQGIEIYKNKVIMYSTGDFVDDYAIYPILRNDWSFLFNIKIDKDGPQEIELVPLLISNMQVNLAPKNEMNQILEKMKGLCEEFKVDVKIKNGIGLIKI